MRFPWSRPANDVEERVERLERAIRDLQLDWDQTYEKFRILAMRLAKRDKREAEEPPPPPPADDLDPVSRAIIAERGGY
jgi:uncharacterized coiled-coil protein SlyX